VYPAEQDIATLAMVGVGSICPRALVRRGETTKRGDVIPIASIAV
jgi:hypothetical protein